MQLLKCCSIPLIYVILTLSNSLQISLILHLGLNYVITISSKNEKFTKSDLLYSLLDALRDLKKKKPHELTAVNIAPILA